MKPFILFISIILFTGIMMAFSTENDKNKDTSANTTTAEVQAAKAAKTEKKIAALLAKMTLKEKIGQLNQYSSSWDVTGPKPKDDRNKLRYEQLTSGQVGSMLNVFSTKDIREAQELAVEKSRLGIPLIFGYDVIHGYKTIFPIPLGETASWDMDILEASARVAGVEASAAGLNWTFAPMVDISRDARWGRIMEGAGEDTYLGSKAAVARVKGFQGDDLGANNTIAACAKHFAAYGFAEAGRDYNTVDISDNTLHNVVLPPFKACVDAGVATFMNAFNEIGGVPATGSSYLQRDILKGDWKFDGFMVSDWGSIGEMIEHGRARNKKEAARIALNAGSDMDMESVAYVVELEGLVKAGKVQEKDIDDAVRRVLRIKFRLGLFDDPYQYCDAKREKNNIYTKEHLAIARDAARKSIVLLKNEGHMLPLARSGKSIAVIGPLAADKDVSLGSWRAQATKGSAVSLLEGVKNAVGKSASVAYAKGCDLGIGERSFIKELAINQTDKSGFDEAIALAKKADIVLLNVGEDCWQSGEARSQVNIGLAGVQQELVEAVVAANPNTVVVLMNGRPLDLSWMNENVPAIVETWHLGSEAGNAIADVLFGDYNPSGKLPVSFPRAVGQVPIYYNSKFTGRGAPEENGMVFWSHYIDEKNTPLYPFGYGLSYTSFDYSDIKLGSKTMKMDGEMKVSVTVKNTGKRDGEEVVQLYIQDLFATITRPVKELKGFEKVMIKAGESKEITFTLTQKDLAFYNADKKWAAEEGEFKIFVGTSSDDVKEASFILE
ncbi:MAG: beta-glucosidase BglX [Chitinophagales bacterium]